MFQQINFLTKITIGYAILLIVVGVGSYVLADANEDADTVEVTEQGDDDAIELAEEVEEESDDPSVTALIPALLGIPLLIAGLSTMNPKIGRYGGMAAGTIVALLMIGSLRGMFLLISGAFSGDEITFPMILQTILVVTSAIYLYVVFRHIRERRQNEAATAA
jgi:hypothetical protein